MAVTQLNWIFEIFSCESSHGIVVQCIHQMVAKLKNGFELMADEHYNVTLWPSRLSNWHGIDND